MVKLIHHEKRLPAAGLAQVQLGRLRCSDQRRAQHNKLRPDG
jgi:hypothetical protein